MADKTNIDNVSLPGLGTLAGLAMGVGSLVMLLFFVTLLGFEPPAQDKYFSPTFYARFLRELAPIPEDGK